MIRGRSAVGLATALAATCGIAAAAASATDAYGPPAGWPSLANAALVAQDIGGSAQIDSQKYVKPDSPDRAEYDRGFDGGKLRGKQLLYTENDVTVSASTAAAQTEMIAIPLGLLIAEKQVANQFGKSLGLKVTYVKSGKATDLGAGDTATGVVIRVGTKAGELRFGLGFVRVEQVISAIILVGAPRANLGLPELKHLAVLSAAHLHAGLAPQSTAAPTVSGTPAVGQVLTAVTGTWLGTPTTYTYAWERCDAAGANCAAIPGGTAATYTASSDDANATLRVTVAAVNAYGAAAPVASAQTAAVAAPATP